MSAQLAVASLIDFPSPVAPTKRPSPKLARHARRCLVCHHADRPEIEDDFLHWRASTEIASDFGLPDRRSVYRHARATGLYQRRMRNMRVASSYIVQHADRVTPNANQVLSAVRACSLIDATGTWNEPVRHVIIEHVNGAPENASAAPSETDISNVYSVQLESAATPTKQTPPTTSNVYSSAVSPEANLPFASTSVASRACGGDNRVAGRDAHQRGALPAPARPTKPGWRRLCPSFIRDLFAKHPEDLNVAPRTSARQVGLGGATLKSETKNGGIYGAGTCGEHSVKG